MIAVYVSVHNHRTENNKNYVIIIITEFNFLTKSKTGKKN
jgi:hypothetical protein